MRIEFDPDKNARNLAERGLSFEQVAEFNFETALIRADTRRDYGETRYIAVGRLHRRLHVLCFTAAPDGIRVISFRKANDREVSRYEDSQALD